MKPYVPKVGIARIPIKYQVSQGEVLITILIPVRVQGQEVYSASLNGKPCYITVSNRPDLRLAVNINRADFEARFEARYPGIYKLVSAINAEQDYYDNFNAMMDDEGNDGVNPPSSPQLTAAQARRRYPIAAAYLDILRYADADPSSDIGYTRRKAGEEAIKAIETGADVIEQREIILSKEANYVSPIN